MTRPLSLLRLITAAPKGPQGTDDHVTLIFKSPRDLAIEVDHDQVNISAIVFTAFPTITV